MNRRVLLIDADPAFRDTLTRELARYKVVVMTEPDAERALALAAADAPALILLTIEDADHPGHRLGPAGELREAPQLEGARRRVHRQALDVDARAGRQDRRLDRARRSG